MTQNQGTGPFPGWLQAGTILLLWGIVFLPVYPELWQTWMSSSNNSHGILVPFISGWLIWTKKEDLARVPRRHWRTGGLILALSLVVYLVAYAGQVAVLQRVMLVCSLIGLVMFNCGKAVMKILAFPLLFLFFMVPVPVSLHGLVAFPLQLFATGIARAMIQFMGLPVLQEGNMLYFARTHLEVAEACSGLRSMTAFFMLSVLFAYFMAPVWWRRGLLVLSAVPLAIAANIVRVTGTGILAHFFGARIARGFLHDFSGLAVFALGLGCLFLEFMLLNKDRPARRKND